MPTKQTRVSNGHGLYIADLAMWAQPGNFVAYHNNYSLKFLRTKIFMDFMVFGAPTKLLSMKISHLAVVAWQSEAIHDNFITKITF